MIFYDFFSGCGGTSQGMREAGFRVKLGIDLDQDAAKTYKTNFPKARFIQRDIRQVKATDIGPHVSASKNRRPIVFGACAPCQPFSKQRHKRARDDVRKDLLSEFHRFIRLYLPEYVFIENVPGLQSIDDTEGPFAKFLQLLKGLGYWHCHEIVFACHYGVPQRRRRLVLIASRLGPISFPEPTHGPRAKKKKLPSVWEAISHFPPIQAGETHPIIPNHRAMNLSVTITKPRGVGLSRALSNEWNSYNAQRERLGSETLDPTENEIERYISGTASKAKIPLNDAARLSAVISEFGDEAMRSIRTLRTDIGALTTEIANKVRDTTRDSFSAITHVVDEVVAELNRLQRSAARIEDLSAVREKLAHQITDIHEIEQRKLERLRDQLNEVNRVWEKDGYDTAELTEAIEEELDELRERRDADLELAQIGLALNTVNHEFDKTVGNIRVAVQRLGAWAAENPELQELHRDLQASFAHLDEYLTLFTQLDRRTHSTKVRITGKQIQEFLERLFSQRLERHRISFSASKQFVERALNSYPSSIYPVFVNLIDNSIYWLQRNRGQREIKLEVDGLDLLVRDNGPGVSTRDRENIFALNFSRKPGGRGMGLHISRQTLARVGLRLSIDPREEGKGASFRISPAKELSGSGRRRYK